MDCRSSHIRTGRPLQICKVLPSLRLFSARSPSVPSMLSGRPTTMSSAFCSWAMRQTSAATLGRAFRVIWGVMGVVRNSVGSQTASPVRLAP